MRVEVVEYSEDVRYPERFVSISISSIAQVCSSTH